jgi:hypothetical protein
MRKFSAAIKRNRHQTNRHQMRVADLFRGLDLDKRGSVSRRELEDGLRRVGLGEWVQEEVQALFDLDTDGDAQISLQELIEGLEAYEEEYEEEHKEEHEKCREAQTWAGQSKHKFIREGKGGSMQTGVLGEGLLVQEPRAAAPIRMDAYSDVMSRARQATATVVAPVSSVGSPNKQFGATGQSRQTPLKKEALGSRQQAERRRKKSPTPLVPNAEAHQPPSPPSPPAAPAEFQGRRGRRQSNWV